MAPGSCRFFLVQSTERSQSVKLLERDAWNQMDFFSSVFYSHPHSLQTFQVCKCALECVCARGGRLPLFSSAQAAEAKNASFALMSDVFMRRLQCHPPWGSCEVAAHVCGAIYSMMKWGDLCWFHIHLPFTRTHARIHTVWAHVPPTSAVLWLYVTANTSMH